MARNIKKILLSLALLACLTLPCEAAQPTELIPVGQTIGIEIQAEDVVVAGFSEAVSAAQEAGLKKGDVIEQINGTPIHCASDISDLLRQTEQPVKVTVRRDGKRRDYLITPQTTTNGKLLGVLVRDTLAGIGTVTYYDPQNGSFGALGHGVNDADTGKLISMRQGSALRASVIHVQRGKAGEPGALRGALEHTQIGTVHANTDSGIFGTLDAFAAEQPPVEVASMDELQTGNATILSSVSGTQTQSYSVRIEKIDSEEAHGRNLLLRITDRELLEQTGGIVQGMSGSPILQNGKLVGAVTHVLVNDPTMGYGIFIGNMLDAAA